MNDDLTPEEREAFSKLPNERTPPAGMEERVVAAMREHGHLARKPARVIRLTNTRVMGLLAACALLIVGAYSIGLHRGVGQSTLTSVEPYGVTLSESALEQPRDERIGVKTPPGELSAQGSEVVSSEMDKQLLEKKAPAFAPKLNVPQLAPPPATTKEKPAKDEVARTMTESFSQRLTKPDNMPAPAAAPAEMPITVGVVKNGENPLSRRFVLPGGTLVVDAPDSVRVVKDEEGRTLLIYTSNGIIRVRLAD